MEISLNDQEKLEKYDEIINENAQLKQHNDFLGLILSTCSPHNKDTIINLTAEIAKLKSDNGRMNKELTAAVRLLKRMCDICIYAVDSPQCKHSGCEVRELRGLVGREETE